MNIAKLIWGNLTYIRTNEKGVKGLMDIAYAVFNTQSGGKLPPLSEDSKDLIYKFTQGDYFAEMLEKWSVDYERSRTQPQQPASFTNDIHSKILSGIGKEGAGKH
jgi:hypothetical protein